MRYPESPPPPHTVAARPPRLPAASSAWNALVVSTVVLATVASAEALVLQVPEDHSTIQAAIDAAPQGAIVLVGPGLYVENIDFLGKAVRLEGAGPDSILDGAGLGPVVRFVNGEGPFSVIDSFTIRGGLANTGGGIEIRDSSPTVLRNVIVGNSARGVGSGIYIAGLGSAPDILNNLLVFNTGVDGGDPHTIQVDDASPAIVNNTIVRNDSNAILTSGRGAPDIRNNILARNGSRTAGGGVKGRGICDFARASTIQYNLFYRNARAALLTASTDFRLVTRAEETLGRPRLAFNLDAAPRFPSRGIPRSIESSMRERFVPGADPERPSRAVGAGDPDPAYADIGGARNTIGFTGGPWAPIF